MGMNWGCVVCWLTKGVWFIVVGCWYCGGLAIVVWLVEVFMMRVLWNVVWEVSGWWCCLSSNSIGCGGFV